MAAGASLRISEIFVSLQGETSLTGLPTVFVRLTGCPLRCRYCDTEYAFHGGEQRCIDDILAEVRAAETAAVTVTGGEPLAQPGVHLLLERLCDQGYRVSLETSGALAVGAVDPRVIKILDLKTPGSGESHRNRYDNLAYCGSNDQIKFVITDRADYEWAKFKCDEHRLHERFGEVLFSPCAESLAPRMLADWILEDRLPVRFQLQLHKLLWGTEPGR